MKSEQIKKLLEDVKTGKINIDQAMEKLKSLPYEDLGFAKIDTHRAFRRGFPEVIFCEGKTPEQVQKIVERMTVDNQTVLAMRADKPVVTAVKKITDKARYYQQARAIVIGEIPKIKNKNKILIISAGTADIGVAEEAAITAQCMGNAVDRLYDAGVAGVHRLLQNREQIYSAQVIIVVAGMEGALPGVVGGLVDKPVIAVPTSIGYGASFKGISALLTMLNSCVPGIGVVNIDNGFGAGYLASMINNLSGK